MNYTRALLEDLGLTYHKASVAYYWVDGIDIRYWSPQATGKLYVTGYDVKEYVCKVLNTHTKEMYSQPYGALRQQLDTYISKYGCVVVKGGPLNGKCRISHYQLPLGVLDVLGITPTEEVTLPDHDLWELVVEGGDTVMSNYIYLVTDGRYTIYADTPDHVLTIRDVVGEVVCTDTLEHCLALNEVLKEVYDKGKKYAATLVARALEHLE